MSFQAKPTLIIIGTLVLGIILGVVGSSALMSEHFQRLHEFGRPHSISNRVLDAVGPLDKATEDSLKVILDQTSERMREKMMQGRKQIRTIIDSTLLQIEPLLTEEEFAKVKDVIGRGPGPRDGKGSRGRFGRKQE